MSEPYVIKMPQLSDTMTEGVMVSWEKNIGDAVKRGDIVATVETDKAVMDVEVFRDGFLSGPLAPIDAVVPVTHAIGYLVESQGRRRSQRGETGCSQRQPPCCASAPAAAAQAPRQCPGSSADTPTAGQQGITAGTQAGRRAGCRYRSHQWFRPGRGGHGHDIQRAPAPFEVAVPGNGRPMKSMEKAISRAMASSISMPTFRVTSHIHLESLMRRPSPPACRSPSPLPRPAAWRCCSTRR